MVFVQRCSLWKDYTFSRDRALTQSRFTDCGDALHHGTRLIDAHFVCEHALYVALPYRNAGRAQVATCNLQSELTQGHPLQPGQGNPLWTLLHALRRFIDDVLDRGGFSELAQAEWFGRKESHNINYQSKTPYELADELRQHLHDDRFSGKLPNALRRMPVEMRNAYAK